MNLPLGLDVFGLLQQEDHMNLVGNPLVGKRCKMKNRGHQPIWSLRNQLQETNFYSPSFCDLRSFCGNSRSWCSMLEVPHPSRFSNQQPPPFSSFSPPKQEHPPPLPHVLRTRTPPGCLGTAGKRFPNLAQGTWPQPPWNIGIPYD